jgi:hypothetical protein
MGAQCAVGRIFEMGRAAIWLNQCRIVQYGWPSQLDRLPQEDFPDYMINSRIPAKAARYSRKNMQFPHINNNKLKHTP